MSKQKWLKFAGIAVLLALVFFLPVAAPLQAAGPPASPPGQVRPPIRYSEVAAPIHPDRPGKGSGGGSVVYPPATIKQAYSFGDFANGGAGQHIAIVDAFGDKTLLTKDVAAFNSRFGLPDATINVWYSGAKPSGNNRNWAIETALDVEWAHASAPNATIELVVTPDASWQSMLDGVNYAANIPGVVAISMSFGGSETSLDATTRSNWEEALQAIRNSGIVLIASSGDAGAYDGTSQLTVEYPASSQYVMGVGGTTLTQNGSTWTETTWTSSGGGYSTLFTDSYQGIANNVRGVPDVAFDANPSTGVYVCYNGLWYAVGGTSVGAPNWAAIVADNAANTNSPHVLTNEYLYGTIYSSSTLYGNEFRDVKSGNNGTGGYSAGTGWDAVTGIGSPNVSNLILAQ